MKYAYKHEHPMLVIIFLWNVIRIPMDHIFLSLSRTIIYEIFANQRYVVIICSEHLQRVCWFVGLELVTNQESTF
jgi:hypothetical protein